MDFVRTFFGSAPKSKLTVLPNLVRLDLDEITKITEKKNDDIRFVCISDTHTETDNLIVPEGDVLLHGGDFTYSGRSEEINHFITFLQKQPHKYKVVIAGNHDLSFDRKSYKKNPEKKTEFIENFTQAVDGLIYLEDSSVNLFGYEIYGSPYSSQFGNWAFMTTENKLEEIYKKIPDNVDILITHGPPKFIGDITNTCKNVGSMSLLNEVQKRIKPKYHLFGHIHEAYGAFSDGITTYINGSTVDLMYQPVNKPIIFDLPKKDN